jgi:aryl-alcohol dehydrogenase-like predicted oxidoreductase
MHCCKPLWVNIFCVLLQVGLLAQGLLAQGVLAQATLRPTVDRVTAGLFDTDRKRIVLATEKTLHILSADELLASATGQSDHKGISLHWICRAIANRF